MAPFLGRRSAFTLISLPAGATHRSNGRGVDVDAGQGDVVAGEQPSHAWVLY